MPLGHDVIQQIKTLFQLLQLAGKIPFLTQFINSDKS
jgi:hypothetical protein